MNNIFRKSAFFMKKFKTRINVPETQQETVVVKAIKFIINKSSILRGLIFDEIYIKIQENIHLQNSEIFIYTQCNMFLKFFN